MAVALKSLPFGTADVVWTGIGAVGCPRRERRLVDQHAILRRDAVGNLDGGGLVRLAVTSSCSTVAMTGIAASWLLSHRGISRL
jgi:hypothetical protein